MRFGVLRLHSIGARMRKRLLSQEGIALFVALSTLGADPKSVAFTFELQGSTNSD